MSYIVTCIGLVQVVKYRVIKKTQKQNRLHDKLNVCRQTQWCHNGKCYLRRWSCVTLLFQRRRSLNDSEFLSLRQQVDLTLRQMVNVATPQNLASE